MAVILDIPMPGGCGKCPLNEDDWGCIITGKPVQEDSRPETCPLHDLIAKPVNPADFSWTGSAIMTDEARKALFPPYTASGCDPSESGPNLTEIKLGR